MPDTTNNLPECCIVRRDATFAEFLYCAYNAAGDPATAGRNYQGLPCPVWSELTPDIRAKWEAVADNARTDTERFLKWEAFLAQSEPVAAPPTPPLSKITWTSELLTPAFPFDVATKLMLQMHGSCPDGCVRVCGYGPDVADLIMQLPLTDQGIADMQAMLGDNDDEATFCLRFGHMSQADHAALPEHGGW